MRILWLQNGSKTKAYRIHAVLGVEEFSQLRSAVSDLCVFSTQRITQPASYTRTGARSQAAKYLLLPAALRRRLPLSQFDFERMTCGAVTYKDSMYVIFRVPGLLGGEWKK